MRPALLHLLAALAIASLMFNIVALAALKQPGRHEYEAARMVRAATYSRPFSTRSGAPLVRRAAPIAPPYAGGPVDWAFKPVQVKVEIDRTAGGASGGGSVPIVVVPVPVPVPAPTAACDVSIRDTKSGGGGEYEEFPAQQPPPATRRPPARLPPPLPDASFPPQSPTPEEDDFALPPRLAPVSSSQQLVEEFRAQTPRAPQLPPMLLSGFDASERARVPDGSNALALEIEEQDSTLAPGQARTAAIGSGYRRVTAAQRGQDSEPNSRSPPPRYSSDSLRLVRGLVTVPRADYTEPYTVWFDETSGNARVDFHDGSTSTFRTAMPDGRVRRAVVWVQRSGPGELRRCAAAVSPQGFSAGRHPALPDLTEFTFAGKEDAASGPVEVWQRTVQGGAGEQGAARGEVLTTRHEMRLTRVNGAAVPLRYTVAVDSSALGPDCDGYEHVYQSDTSQPIPSKFFDVDLDNLCDVVENLNPSSDEDVAKLEPLREFTLPHRDLRYDQVFDNYRTQYARQYADEREEAVRKNVIMQSSRFSAAGNRQGATSELGATLLADRLRVEVRRMMGAEGAATALATGSERDSFPYSRDNVRTQESRLPSSFDWRARGAVSPVGFQGFNCASCWAFAVSGAVEGALFRRTQRLVPLSYQCLVDCAHPFGGNGCSGTWPSHAYNYVQERGLPALDEYPPYKEKVDKCVEQRVPSQTRVSGHVNVTTNSVPALKVAIRRHAPNVVIVDADCQSFILHKKGVLYDDRCGKALRQLHHAVLAVGWGERRNEPHFILKNSWSAKWGEKGYIRVHARSNTCGVLTMPSYPVLEEGDVRQPLRAGARKQRHDSPYQLASFDVNDLADAIHSDYL